MLKQQKISISALLMISESYKELVREVAALSASMTILAKASMRDVAAECKPTEKGGRKRKQASSVRASRSLQDIDSDDAPSASEDPLPPTISSFTKSRRLSLLPPYKPKRAVAPIAEEETMNDDKGAASQLQ